MKLNIGAGHTRIEGFLNVDHEKFPETDMVSKADKLDFAKDGSIEEIYASNVLEHYGYPQALDTLKEWARVLISKGKIYISVPDMIAITEYINRNGWDRWIGDIVYGGTEIYEDRHSSGFDFNMLNGYLAIAGFGNIYKIDKFPFDLIDCSQCKARDKLFNKSYLVVLNVVAEKL